MLHPIIFDADVTLQRYSEKMKLCIILLLRLTLSLLASYIHITKWLCPAHIKWEAVATESEWFWLVSCQSARLSQEIQPGIRHQAVSPFMFSNEDA